MKKPTPAQLRNQEFNRERWKLMRLRNQIPRIISRLHEYRQYEIMQSSGLSRISEIIMKLKAIDTHLEKHLVTLTQEQRSGEDFSSNYVELTKLASKGINI
jgi:division protein CdvB (Snf7/Vps24/ESCRT-III family)